MRSEILRAFLILIVLGVPAIANPAIANASPTGVASVESMLTRYGTSHQTLYQLNVKPEVSIYRGPASLTISLPLAGGFTQNNSCCRFTLGNATLGGAYTIPQLNSSWRLSGSVSLPTSQLTDSKGYASGVASTTEITRDAGYYLPRTTTLRTNIGVEREIIPRFAMGGSVGTHVWIHESEDRARQFILPFRIYGRATITDELTSSVAMKTIFNLSADNEQWIHQVSAQVHYTWDRSTIGAGMRWPIDKSLRDLGMLSTGVSLARIF